MEEDKLELLRENEIEDAAFEKLKQFCTAHQEERFREQVTKRYIDMVLTVLTAEIMTEHINFLCTLGLHKYIDSGFLDWHICKRCGARTEVRGYYSSYDGN